MTISTRIGRLLALAAAVIMGCEGGPRKKPVFQVHGQLTYMGQPMANASVTFHSVDANDRTTPAHATTDADGHYELHTYRAGDGAPAGECIVTIHWPGTQPRSMSKLKSLDPEDIDNPVITVDQLGNKYLTVSASSLRATVEPKDNTIDFHLK